MSGDLTCPTCGQYHCVCGRVLQSLHGGNPILRPDDAELTRLRSEVERLRGENKKMRKLLVSIHGIVAADYPGIAETIATLLEATR